MTKKTCKHCGYSWTPRIETEPKACPMCKSPRWNELKRKSGRPKKSEIYNLKKMDFGRYLIGNNIDAETGRGLIANPEKYGLKNFEIMKLTYKNDTAAINIINQLIEMAKAGQKGEK